MDPYEYISSASKTLDRSEDYARHTLEFRTPSFGKKVQSQSVDTILQVAKECLEREIATFELECVLEGKNTVWITVSNRSSDHRILPDHANRNWRTAQNIREFTTMDPYGFLKDAYEARTEVPYRGTFQFSSRSPTKKISLAQVEENSKILGVAKSHLRTSLPETYSGDCVLALCTDYKSKPITHDVIWVTVEAKSKGEIAFTRRMFDRWWTGALGTDAARARELIKFDFEGELCQSIPEE